MAQPSPPLPANPANRRTATRHEVSVEVGLESDHNFYTGLTQDISTGGLFVATHQIKRVGDHVTLKFTLPGQAGTIDVETEVRWVRESTSLSRADGEPGMGLRFLNLTPEASRAITSFLNQRDSLFYDDE